MKRILSLLLCGTMLFALVSCGGGDSSSGETPSSASGSVSELEEPLDLTGEWVQTNSNSEDSIHGAYITGNTIEVYWIMEDSTALYWAGTFTAPEGSPETYSWTSENDTDRTSTALLASGDETKEFTYADGVISYEAAAMGVTMTVELERGEWGYTPSWNEEEQEEEAGETTLSPAADLGDYHVEIKGATLTTDYEGNLVIVITYSWTNNSDDTTSALTSVNCSAFQDGVGLESAFVLSDDVYDSGLGMTEVRPGTTIDVQSAFVLTSETSIVEVEISEWITFDNDAPIAYQEFDPATL